MIKKNDRARWGPVMFRLMHLWIMWRLDALHVCVFAFNGVFQPVTE